MLKMQAMIFAAGLGTRLKPLTDTMPKALVRVGGKPLIERLIEKLKDAGADRIVVNVHHLRCRLSVILKTTITSAQTSECLTRQTSCSTRAEA